MNRTRFLFLNGTILPAFTILSRLLVEIFNRQDVSSLLSKGRLEPSITDNVLGDFGAMVIMRWRNYLLLNKINNLYKDTILKSICLRPVVADNLRGFFSWQSFHQAAFGCVLLSRRMRYCSTSLVCFMSGCNSPLL